MPDQLKQLIESIEQFFTAESMDFSCIAPVGHERGKFLVHLPGTNKLKTTACITVTEQLISFEAFICRNPDENFANVYKYLLKRNKKLYLISYTLDNLGDIYLVGKIATDIVTLDTIDTILGQIAQVADEDFNILLQLGFASSIIKEWKWRSSRGESLANLKPFEHLIKAFTGSDLPSHL